MVADYKFSLLQKKKPQKFIKEHFFNFCTSKIKIFHTLKQHEVQLQLEMGDKILQTCSEDDRLLVFSNVD